MEGERQTCPLCQQSAEIAVDHETISVRCGRCRPFSLSPTLIAEVGTLDCASLAALSAAAFQMDESGGALVLDSSNLRKEIAAHRNRSLGEKLNLVIRAARRRTAHFGAPISLQPETEYLLFDAVSPVEAWALVQQQEQDGVLACNTADQLYYGSLTRKGWEIAERQGDDSGQPSGKRSEYASDMAGRVFRVAFSFPGEARYRIGPIAAILAETLAPESVFYDEWYKAELARPNLDLHLQQIYTRAELVVVCLCAAYEIKQWCGLEWRAVRDLIKKREERIMFLRLDDAPVSGAYSIDGYVDLRHHSDSETAALIGQRVSNVSLDITSNPGAAPLLPVPLPRTADRAAPAEVSKVHDLTIDISEIAHGFAVRARNDDLDPVENCRVLMERLDRYLPAKRDFSRNAIEPMTVLFARHIPGGGSSDGYAFATCPTNFSSLGFQAGVPEQRKKPIAELTTEDIWIAEFTLYREARVLSRAAIFIKVAPGRKPALVSDPRQELPQPTPPPIPLAYLKNLRVRITPMLPIARAGDEFIVRDVTNDRIELTKSSGYIITIPTRRVADDLPASGGSQETRLLELNGRLQWLSLSRTWKFFPEHPKSSLERQYGFSRATSPEDPLIMKIQERGQKVRFARRDNIPRYEQEGYLLVYDESGLFLTHGDLILLASGA